MAWLEEANKKKAKTQRSEQEKSENAKCKSQHQKNVRPRSVLLAFHTIQRVARCMHFWFDKPAKNFSKTTSEPFKNRCKKHVVFHHRVSWALASIWEPLGLKVGAKLAVLETQGPPQRLQNPVFYEHVSKMLPKRLPSGSKRGPKEGPELNFRRILIDLKAFSCYFWHAFLMSIQNNCSHENEKNAEPAITS